jgi:hypothetical protein
MNNFLCCFAAWPGMYNAAKDILIPLVSILASIIVAYLTALYTIRREARQGRLRMLELVRRYFLNVLNAFDPHTKQIKQDPLSKRMYVEVLKDIFNELSDLVAHPYFSVLVARYPLLSKLLVQVRRELVEHDVQTLFAINVGTMAEFWQLHVILKKDMPKIMNSDLDKTIIGIASRQGLESVA